MEDKLITTTKPNLLIKYWWVALLIVIVIMAATLIGILISRGNSLKNSPNNSNTTPTPTVRTPSPSPTIEETEAQILWTFDGNEWKHLGVIPECDSPLTIPLPADLATATNILYPGQTRGGDYKPHGGIRYDKAKNNDMNVKLPIDAVLWRGSRYVESGEIQYMLDFIAPCGIMFRFDHLLTLTAEFQQLVNAQLPEATESSATTNFNPPIVYKKGTIIATAIGHKKPSLNASFDFGVYDLRQRNMISTNSTWAAKYSNKKETAYYAVCWLDLLPDAEKTKAKSLPGAGTEGKVSDYCK